MKKTLTIVVAVLLVVAFAACGPKSDTGAPKGEAKPNVTTPAPKAPGAGAPPAPAAPNGGAPAPAPAPKAAQ